ncbi:unnamed protein product, partial [Rotaria socialis]
MPVNDNVDQGLEKKMNKSLSSNSKHFNQQESLFHSYADFEETP